MHAHKPPQSSRKTPPFFFSLPKTSNQPPLTSHAPLSLLKPTGAPLFEQTLLNPLKPEPLCCSHGLQCKLQQNQPSFRHDRVRRGVGASVAEVICKFRHAIGFRARIFRYWVRNNSSPVNCVQTLPFFEIHMLGLGFGCVPFHAGWELAE